MPPLLLHLWLFQLLLAQLPFGAGTAPTAALAAAPAVVAAVVGITAVWLCHCLYRCPCLCRFWHHGRSVLPLLLPLILLLTICCC
jgi:hypothetical protein